MRPIHLILCYVSRFLYHASTSPLWLSPSRVRFVSAFPLIQFLVAWVVRHLFHYCPSYSSPSISLTQQMKKPLMMISFCPSSDHCIEHCDLTSTVPFIFCQSTTELAFKAFKLKQSPSTPSPRYTYILLGRGDSCSLVSNLWPAYKHLHHLHLFATCVATT